MLASGGKILALGKVYTDEGQFTPPSLLGAGRPGDRLHVNPEWVVKQVNDKVSGASKEWVEQNFQPSGDYVSATDFNEYKTQVQQEFNETSSWANDTFQPKGNYASASDIKEWALEADVAKEFSATSAWANKTFQPSGDYASASDIKEWALKTEVAEEFHNTSAWAEDTFQPKGDYQPSGDYVSASDFEDYKKEVSSAFSATSAWANNTFVTNNTFNEFKTEITNEVEQKFYTSAFSASFSSAFNQEFNTYIQSASSGWDCKEYSAGPGIKIEDHIVSLEPSAVPFDNYYTKEQTSGKNQLSDEFNKYKEWSETSAWAEQTFIPKTASANWDLEEYSGKDGIKVEDHWIGISADFITPQELETALTPYAKTEALSAIPTLKSTDHSVGIETYTSAGHVEYDLKVEKMPEIHISGERGISAQDLGDGNWLIGASADNLAYLYGSFSKNNSETVTSGDIIKFIGIEKDITVDSDGYITVPNSVDKLTICLNATIDNNIPYPDPHNYMLNQFVLSAVGGDALLTTHDYYPSEVGAADANIATTLQHVPGRKYCVVYLGSDALQQSHLDVNLSMIEEVISLSDNSGQATPYNGEPPIYVLNQNISLKYDDEIFTLKSKTESGITKQYLTLAQTSGGQVSPVDPEVFNKLLNSVNRRIVETLPIGIVNNTNMQGINVSQSYLFRPMIEFDMTPNTTARILTYNASENSSQVQVAVYEVNESNGELTLMWISEVKTLTKQSGEHVLHAHSTCTSTRTIYPEKLYYVEVKSLNQQVGFIGITNNITMDTGVGNLPDVAYHKSSGVAAEQVPAKNGQNCNQLGQTGQANFKPYVGFRNDV